MPEHVVPQRKRLYSSTTTQEIGGVTFIVFAWRAVNFIVFAWRSYGISTCMVTDADGVIDKDVVENPDPVES